jgi:hypothetical protein
MSTYVKHTRIMLGGLFMLLNMAQYSSWVVEREIYFGP